MAPNERLLIGYRASVQLAGWSWPAPDRPDLGASIRPRRSTGTRTVPNGGS